jgi:hypothetical protein
MILKQSFFSLDWTNINAKLSQFYLVPYNFVRQLKKKNTTEMNEE